MSELIREWLLGITAAAILLALVDHLVPEGGIKRIAGLAGGMILVLAAIGPVVKLDESALENLTSQYGAEVQNRSEELKMEQDILYESIIEEHTAAYILDKANEIGMSCRVSVTAAWDGDVPIPCAVKLWGSWTQQQRDTISQWLESELGISTSVQYFEETER